MHDEMKIPDMKPVGITAAEVLAHGPVGTTAAEFLAKGPAETTPDEVVEQITAEENGAPAGRLVHFSHTIRRLDLDKHFAPLDEMFLDPAVSDEKKQARSQAAFEAALHDPDTEVLYHVEERIDPPLPPEPVPGSLASVLPPELTAALGGTPWLRMKVWTAPFAFDPLDEQGNADLAQLNATVQELTRRGTLPAGDHDSAAAWALAFAVELRGIRRRSALRRLAR